MTLFFVRFLNFQEKPKFTYSLSLSLSSFYLTLSSISLFSKFLPPIPLCLIFSLQFKTKFYLSSLTHIYPPPSLLLLLFFFIYILIYFFANMIRFILFIHCMISVMFLRLLILYNGGGLWVLKIRDVKRQKYEGGMGVGKGEKKKKKKRR